jgi:hypothetical protein
MELKTIQEIERAIDALPPQEQAALYSWIDRHRPSSQASGPSSGRETPVSEKDDRHIWDVIADNMKDVPQQDFAALPKDGLSQIDHYVHGVPKRTR